MADIDLSSPNFVNRREWEEISKKLEGLESSNFPVALAVPCNLPMALRLNLKSIVRISDWYMVYNEETSTLLLTIGSNSSFCKKALNIAENHRLVPHFIRHVKERLNRPTLDPSDVFKAKKQYKNLFYFLKVAHSEVLPSEWANVLGLLINIVKNVEEKNFAAANKAFSKLKAVKQPYTENFIKNCSKGFKKLSVTQCREFAMNCCLEVCSKCLPTVISYFSKDSYSVAEPLPSWYKCCTYKYCESWQSAARFEWFMKGIVEKLEGSTDLSRLEPSDEDMQFIKTFGRFDLNFGDIDVPESCYVLNDLKPLKLDGFAHNFPDVIPMCGCKEKKKWKGSYFYCVDCRRLVHKDSECPKCAHMMSSKDWLLDRHCNNCEAKTCYFSTKTGIPATHYADLIQKMLAHENVANFCSAICHFLVLHVCKDKIKLCKKCICDVMTIMKLCSLPSDRRNFMKDFERCPGCFVKSVEQGRNEFSEDKWDLLLFEEGAGSDDDLDLSYADVDVYRHAHKTATNTTDASKKTNKKQKPQKKSAPVEVESDIDSDLLDSDLMSNSESDSDSDLDSDLANFSGLDSDLKDDSDDDDDDDDDSDECPKLVSESESDDDIDSDLLSDDSDNSMPRLKKVRFGDSSSDDDDNDTESSSGDEFAYKGDSDEDDEEDEGYYAEDSDFDDGFGLDENTIHEIRRQAESGSGFGAGLSGMMGNLFGGFGGGGGMPGMMHHNHEHEHSHGHDFGGHGHGHGSGGTKRVSIVHGGSDANEHGCQCGDCVASRKRIAEKEKLMERLHARMEEKRERRQHDPSVSEVTTVKPSLKKARGKVNKKQAKKKKQQQRKKKQQQQKKEEPKKVHTSVQEFDLNDILDDTEDESSTESSSEDEVAAKRKAAEAEKVNIKRGSKYITAFDSSDDERTTSNNSKKTAPSNKKKATTNYNKKNQGKFAAFSSSESESESSDEEIGLFSSLDANKKKQQELQKEKERKQQQQQQQEKERKQQQEKERKQKQQQQRADARKAVQNSPSRNDRRSRRGGRNDRRRGGDRNAKPKWEEEKKEASKPSWNEEVPEASWEETKPRPQQQQRRQQQQQPASNEYRGSAPPGINLDYLSPAQRKAYGIPSPKSAAKLQEEKNQQQQQQQQETQQVQEQFINLNLDDDGFRSATEKKDLRAERIKQQRAEEQRRVEEAVRLEAERRRKDNEAAKRMWSDNRVDYSNSQQSAVEFVDVSDTQSQASQASTHSSQGGMLSPEQMRLRHQQMQQRRAAEANHRNGQVPRGNGPRGGAPRGSVPRGTPRGSPQQRQQPTGRPMARPRPQQQNQQQPNAAMRTRGPAPRGARPATGWLSVAPRPVRGPVPRGARGPMPRGGPRGGPMTRGPGMRGPMARGPSVRPARPAFKPSGPGVVEHQSTQNPRPVSFVNARKQMTY